MKVAISSYEANLQSKVDERFGRAQFLLIYDTETTRLEAIDNSTNSNVIEGAGIKAAELIINKNCTAVITGHLGPKAFSLLNKSGIKGYLVSNITIAEAIEQLQNNSLTKAPEADVESHW